MSFPYRPAVLGISKYVWRVSLPWCGSSVDRALLNHSAVGLPVRVALSLCAAGTAHGCALARARRRTGGHGLGAACVGVPVALLFGGTQLTGVRGKTGRARGRKAPHGRQSAFLVLYGRNREKGKPREVGKTSGA